MMCSGNSNSNSFSFILLFVLVLELPSKKSMAVYMLPHVYYNPIVMYIANQGNSHCSEILFQVTLLFQLILVT